MVSVGGLTRLTRSGLSMTDWRFEWESPPLTDGDWSREFDKYRASPEFRKTNSKMPVAEYKREGISVADMSYVDNTAVVTLIDALYALKYAPTAVMVSTTLSTSRPSTRSRTSSSSERDVGARAAAS